MAGKTTFTKIKPTALVETIASHLKDIEMNCPKTTVEGELCPPRQKTREESAKDLLEAFVATCGHFMATCGELVLPNLLNLKISPDRKRVYSARAKQLCLICDVRDENLGWIGAPMWFMKELASCLSVPMVDARMMMVALIASIRSYATCRISVPMPGMGTFRPSLMPSRTLNRDLKGFNGPVVVPERYDYRLELSKTFRVRYCRHRTELLPKIIASKPGILRRSCYGTRTEPSWRNIVAASAIVSRRKRARGAGELERG